MNNVIHSKMSFTAKCHSQQNGVNGDPGFFYSVNHGLLAHLLSCHTAHSCEGGTEGPPIEDLLQSSWLYHPTVGLVKRLVEPEANTQIPCRMMLLDVLGFVSPWQNPTKVSCRNQLWIIPGFLFNCGSDWWTIPVKPS